MMIITNSDISIYQQCSVILYSEILLFSFAHYDYELMIVAGFYCRFPPCHENKEGGSTNRVILGIYNVTGHGALSFIQIMFKDTTNVFFHKKILFSRCCFLAAEAALGFTMFVYLFVCSFVSNTFLT